MDYVEIAPCFCGSTTGETVKVPAMRGNTARLNRPGYSITLCADCGTEHSREIVED